MKWHIPHKRPAVGLHVDFQPRPSASEIQHALRDRGGIPEHQLHHCERITHLKAALDLLDEKERTARLTQQEGFDRERWLVEINRVYRILGVYPVAA